MLSLTTTRLTLDRFSPDDEVLLHLLFTDPYARQYLWDNEILEKEVTIDILRKNEAYFQNHRWGLWKIQLKDTGDVIGFAGLWPFFDEQQPQLLYGLFQKYTGRGYATEAAAAVAKYCFDQLGFSYLTASMDEPNAASHKVAGRLGMKLAGRRIENGKPTVFYRLEKSR